LRCACECRTHLTIFQDSRLQPLSQRRSEMRAANFSIRSR
jgi:hypothetical protein